MKLTVTTYHMKVPLNKKQWGRLQRIEATAWRKSRTRPTSDEFNKLLREAGACNVEFNGHFGRNIFFQAETLEAAGKITALIESIL